MHSNGGEFGAAKAGEPQSRVRHSREMLAQPLLSRLTFGPTRAPLVGDRRPVISGLGLTAMIRDEPTNASALAGNLPGGDNDFVSDLGVTGRVMDILQSGSARPAGSAPDLASRDSFVGAHA
jgi:hypothetical protein